MMNYNLIIILNLVFGNASILFLSDIAIAGTRRCQGIADTAYCIDEKGSRTFCSSSPDGVTTVCTGANSYRKECNQYANNTSICNDNKGVKVRCKNFANRSECENSKGYRTICRSYDGRVTICTDYDLKGNPI
jgi:hypothetical protein